MSTTPAAYFINTDAGSLGDTSPHDDWMALGHAFAGGADSYGRNLGKLRPGDLLLMWANTVGVVAVGRVAEKWDGIKHIDDAWIYVEPYPDAGQEYRIAVDWFLDLRQAPLRTADIKARGIQNTNPRGPLSRIRNVGAVIGTVDALKLLPPTTPPTRPGRQAFADALIRLSDQVHDNHKAVVAALHQLPGHEGTIGDVARVLGWASPSTVNLRFGELGRRLGKEVGQDPELRRTGTPQWWNILAEGMPSSRGFLWTLHPDVVGALRDAGWVNASFALADEVAPEEVYVEGAVTTVRVNAYERSTEARNACLRAHGTRCTVCEVDMGERYGTIGDGFIHVHHLRPLATVGGDYKVDPVEDLRPVCPNCHAMLHRPSALLSIEDLRAILQARKRSSRHQMNDTMDAVTELLHAHDLDDRFVEDRAYGDGGTDMLFARLHRAAMNHVEDGSATGSRYGIWAMTCRDHLEAAKAASTLGDRQTAEQILHRVANGLAAFAAIQALMDPPSEA